MQEEEFENKRSDRQGIKEPVSVVSTTFIQFGRNRTRPCLVDREVGRGRVVPGRLGPSEGGHDEVWSPRWRGAGEAAAAGAHRAVLQAGRLGGQRADIGQVPRGQGAHRATRRGYTVHLTAVHHGLLTLLSNTNTHTHIKTTVHLADLFPLIGSLQAQ